MTPCQVAAIKARLSAGQAAPKTPKEERHVVGKEMFHLAPGRPHAIIQSDTIAKPAQLQPTPSHTDTPSARKDEPDCQLDLRWRGFSGVVALVRAGGLTH